MTIDLQIHSYSQMSSFVTTALSCVINSVVFSEASLVFSKFGKTVWEAAGARTTHQITTNLSSAHNFKLNSGSGLWCAALLQTILHLH